MIPGALEVHVGKPRREQAAASEPAPPVPQSGQDARYDRGRAEHQIEGGGALSERRPGRHQSWVAKLGQAIQRYAMPAKTAGLETVGTRRA